jgi:hypothetical protein
VAQAVGDDHSASDHGKWVSDLKDPARGSNVRIGCSHADRPTLVIDYDRNRVLRNHFAKYGRSWLLPYMTDKDPLEEHPVAYMWFDDLIVSRTPIAPALD